MSFSKPLFHNVLPLLALVVCSIASARAGDWAVFCPDSKINEVLNALDSIGPHTIWIAGTCNENITIAQRHNVTLRDMPPWTASIVAADPAMPTVGVYSSHGVTLENLTIENGAPGLLVTQQSQVVLRNSVVQKNAPNGVDVLIGSVLEVDGGSIIDNQRNGLRTDSSVVWVGPERLFIARNLGGAGLNVVASDIEVNNGALTVEDNNTAVSVVSGRLTLFGPATGDGVIFQNNKAGLNFVNASAFRVASAFVIRNNGQIGIRMAGSSAQIGSPGVIEGHSINGVSVGSLSRFTITGGMTRIQNNGNSTNPERGGIRLDGGASLDATNITISENGGFGLLAIQNSRMTIGDATISNNSDAGVTVRRLSSAHFDNPPVISSSGRASIVCDTTSLVSGNLTGVAGIDCSRIEREVGPPHDGTVH